MIENRKTRLALAVGAALLSLAGGVEAAPPSNEELQKQLVSLKATIEALQKQVQEQSEALSRTREAIPEGGRLATSDDITGLQSQLEDTKYNLARDREYKTAQTTRGLTIGGTLTGTYNATSRPSAATSNNPVGEPAKNSFGASATLSFSGNLYRDYAEGRNLDYKLAFAYSNPKLANNNSSNTPAQGDTVTRLTDVYIQYKLLPDTGALEEPKLTVAFGQQKIPFGLEAQVSDELRPTVSTAQFLGSSALNNLNQRQIGVVLRGDYEPSADYGFNYRAPLLEYNFGILNGNGANTADDNNRKDYVGRVALIVPADYNSWLRELKFGASFYQGWKNLSTSGGAPVLLFDDARTSRRGFDFSYNHNPIGFTYELANGNDEALVTPASAASAVKTQRSRGQVATLFYNFGDIAQWSKNLNQVGKYDDFWPTTSQVYYRYDIWDPNLDAASDRTVKHTIGYNLFFAQTTKFQIGLTRTLYDAGLKKPDSTDLTALLQYGF